MKEINSDIQIYVACLASYNNGILHGGWIDACQDADDIRYAIHDILKTSPIEGRKNTPSMIMKALRASGYVNMKTLIMSPSLQPFLKSIES